MRANALRGSRTFNNSAVDLIAAAGNAEVGVNTTTARNFASPCAPGGGAGEDNTVKDATTLFDRRLGRHSATEGNGGWGGGGPSRAASAGTTAAGRPTRTTPRLASTVSQADSGGGSGATRVTRSATTDMTHHQHAMVADVASYGAADPRETWSGIGAGEVETAADAGTAAAEFKAAAAAAAAAAEAELARQRDPLWKYKQQVCA